ncbi:hypothetical protein EVAR_97868_1 [Eumeta japonica]|uniref:Uncharacterized protein n=1 Tax=Eumeta variegata TaxID=151549 RepID=A0A4C1WXR3_EUMVA|nr:hypothetical protein EVAR_97868_1 [Eumeta japonica]
MTVSSTVIYEKYKNVVNRSPNRHQRSDFRQQKDGTRITVMRLVRLKQLISSHVMFAFYAPTLVQNRWLFDREHGLVVDDNSGSTAGFGICPVLDSNIDLDIDVGPPMGINGSDN